MKNLLSSEFNYDNFEGIANFDGIFDESRFHYSIQKGKIKSSGFFIISDIFYMDSMSIFDKPFRANERSSYLKRNISALQSVDFADDEINKKIIEVHNKINDLLQGKFGHSKVGGFSFIGNDGSETNISNASSGIKQIGVIERLLAYRKLKKNSFFIIDEPEVNLHPKWQVKLAEILTILAKDLNVHIYINTHSPMFIEAMSVYSEYYNLLDETNFYLTENHPETGFYFKKIVHNNMGAVYENLAKPYDELDKIKAIISERI